MSKVILSTLGPSSLNGESIRRLDELGVGVFRLNLSHTPVAALEGLISLIREHSDAPICLDTQGAQIRTGSLAEGTITLETGAIIDLVPAPAEGQGSVLPLYPAWVLPNLMVGDLISIDFDSVPIQVIESGPTCRARVLSSGTVGSNKAVSVDRGIVLPPLTDPDWDAIDVGLRLGVEYIALSFTHTKDDVLLLRNRVGPEVSIIAKIESRQSLENLDGILEAADAVLIDRGDLAREVPIENLPFIQKEVINRANKAQVPVYVATNLLESMVVNARPTRAEANDVINTLLDGADGLVLAAETAVGNYPVGCVSMIRSLIGQFEARAYPPWADNPLPSSSRLVPPHGGKLVSRWLDALDHYDWQGLPRLDVSESVMMDVKQIAIGTYSPLEGFMGNEELQSVLDKSRLPDGTVWPLPILLQLPAESPGGYQRGETVSLAFRGEVQALMEVGECFTRNLDELAAAWYGTSSREHPGVNLLLQGSNRFLSGKIGLLPSGLQNRQSYEMTPAQSRQVFEHRQWQRVVGFHTRNVPHRAHEYLQFTALSNNQCDGIFIHPVTGPKKPGDFSGDINLKTYQLLIDQFYPPNTAVLGGFVTYSRYAGPREAVFTAICRQNFGCSHFIVGRDHTGVGDFYTPQASQRLFAEVGDLAVQPVFFDEVYYCRSCEAHVEHCQHGQTNSLSISGTEARRLFNQGEMPPDWHMREPVSRMILEELRSGAQVFSA